jgi:ammonium transporter, Amt family
VGTVGSLFYSIGCRLLDKFHIDDPLEASAVHTSGGFWGVMAVGFFHTEKGLFYNGSLGIKQLGLQLLGAVAIIVWVTAITLPFFLLMRRLNLLRVPKEIEVIGLDISELGGVPDEVYQKLKRDFGFLSPSASVTASFN